MWEDARPGSGRPQEIINQQLDTCDLFIGLLWRKWGTDTGEYSSGFEEEFERARKRRQDNGSPEIWLCFRRVEPDLIKDPGEGLKKVLAFRKLQEERKEFLFIDFEDAEDWRKKINRWLLQYILERTNQSQKQAESPATVATPVIQTQGNSSTLAIPEEGKQPTNTQVKEAIRYVDQAIEAGYFGNLFQQTELRDEFNASRLYLLAMTWVSLWSSDELLGVHEANLLYNHREKLEPTPAESQQIFRTLIGQWQNSIPGWYWFSNQEFDTLVDQLLVIALNDPSIAIQNRALEILNAARICPTTDWAKKWEILKLIPINKDTTGLKLSLRYIGEVGMTEDIPVVESQFSHENAEVRAEAATAKLLIVARHNPTYAFTALLSDNLADKERVIFEISKMASDLDSRSLTNALENADKDIRLFAVKELGRRGEFSKKKAITLLQDASEQIRQFCCKELVKEGVQIDADQILKAVPDQTYLLQIAPSRFIPVKEYTDSNAIILELYKSFSTEELLGLVEWDSSSGVIAYKALALYHFPRVAIRIRSDLKEHFEQLKREFLDNLVIKHRDSAEALLELYESSNYELAAFTSAALSGLAHNGEPSDVEVARRYLSDNDYDVRVEAVHIIERFGDKTDIQILIDVAKNSEGLLQVSAARTALKLSQAGETVSTTRELLETGKATLISVTIEFLLNYNRGLEISEFLRAYLDSQDDSIRQKVLYYFAKNYSESELEQLLEIYRSRPVYYYSVVCWLDRIIYAHSSLKNMFLRELEANLKLDLGIFAISVTKLGD
jgi:HEAT repeat protein